MRLYADKPLFLECIRKTSEHLDLNESFVEKDYWITEILKNLACSDQKNNFVFKGGTSLSKAYKVIQRFSEDIDISPIKKQSDNKNKKFFKTMERIAIQDIPLKEHKKESDPKKGSKRRSVAYAYPQKANQSLSFINSGRVILESSSFYNLSTRHIQIKTISSFIEETLSQLKEKEIIKTYNLNPFEIPVQSQEITFSEKLICLLRLSFKNINNFQNKDRHFYDISEMYKQNNIKSYLKKDDFLNDLNEIYKEEEEDFIIDNSFSKTNLFLHLDKILKSLQNTNHFQGLLFNGEDYDFSEIENAFNYLKSILYSKTITKNKTTNH